MKIQAWIEKYRRDRFSHVQQVPLAQCDPWHYDKGAGKIRRTDQSFFQITGLVDSDNEYVLIDQPEVGILGFLVAEDEHGIKVLLHAKSEPGNVNITQIGPSVQATQSNYKAKHNGVATEYLHFFLQPKDVIFSTLQSEQGTRFLNKYNLNIAVWVEEDNVKINEQRFRWFYLAEILSELNSDFLFNTDFKSVLSQLVQTLSKGKVAPDEQVLAQLRIKRAEFQQDLREVPLHKLQTWELGQWNLSACKMPEYRFSFFDCALADREVTAWRQPLICKETTEHIALLGMRNRYGVRFPKSYRM